MTRTLLIAGAAALLLVALGFGLYAWFQADDGRAAGPATSAALRQAVDDICRGETDEAGVRGRAVRKVCDCTLAALRNRVPAGLARADGGMDDDEKIYDFFQENFDAFERCLDKHT